MDRLYAGMVVEGNFGVYVSIDQQSANGLINIITVTRSYGLLYPQIHLAIHLAKAYKQE